MVALTGLENHLRSKAGIAGTVTVTEASSLLVRYADPVRPNAGWVGAYAAELASFEATVTGLVT